MVGLTKPEIDSTVVSLAGDDTVVMAFPLKDCNDDYDDDDDDDDDDNDDGNDDGDDDDDDDDGDDDGDYEYDSADLYEDFFEKTHFSKNGVKPKNHVLKRRFATPKEVVNLLLYASKRGVQNITKPRKSGARFDIDREERTVVLSAKKAARNIR